MKVAIVHYWLVGMRGGEKVLDEICNLFPNADIFTLVADVSVLSQNIRQHKITTSFLQKIGGKKYYRALLPLMPIALEGFDLTEYDLVISSEAGPAKGVITSPHSVHICYCHSPMRYIWDLEPQYRASASRIKRFIMAILGPKLRQWDVTTAARVDYFIANSRYVARRIEKFYRREAIVINPPVELRRFKPSVDLDENYLCAGQITPYKRIEIAINAFNQMGRRLDIIGGGAPYKLKSIAGPTIRFLGAVSDEVMERALARCQALIVPGVEDFGITPLEAMASGRPVIAFARGGATETIIDGKTGILFAEQTAESLIEAVKRFEMSGAFYTSRSLREYTEQYSPEIFRNKIRDFVGNIL